MFTGIVQENASEISVGSLKFGLNTAFFTGISIVTPEDAKNETGAFDFNFKIGDTDFKKRLYPITQVRDNSETITDPNHEKFKKALIDQGSWLTSFFKVFTNEETLKNAVEATYKAKGSALSLKEYVQAMYKTNTKEQYQLVKVDIFLEYGQEREGKKYLELSGTRKFGKFITKHIEGTFKEVKDAEGLHFINEAGLKHDISRNKWWLDNSNGAKASVGVTASTTMAGAVMSSPGMSTAAQAAPNAGSVDDVDW